MADQSLPQFIENDQGIDQPIVRPGRSTPRSLPRVMEAAPAQRRLRLFANIDPYLVVVVGILLGISMIMVFSTTFDWSYQVFGDPSLKFFEHVQKIVLGGVVMLVLSFIDYRIWRRLAVVMLLATIAALIAVLLFGDDAFGARRALINGSFQPGELAEFVIVIYMAAWLSSKKTRIRSFTFGLLPFLILMGIIGVLIALQPDLSTVVTIFLTAGLMFFLAGGDLLQLTGVGAVGGAVGFVWLTSGGSGYAQERVANFVSGSADLTQAGYHVQQAITAFSNGGWMGRGLGQSLQKFGYLPAPHTDSIFAVIGEELGVVGAAFVIALYIALVIRGFYIARRSADSFGALLAAGLTLWVVIKALLNIAVMTGTIPATGVPLPFISFGGSSLMVLLAGIGMMLSVGRVAARQNSSERRNIVASHDSGRRDRRNSLPGAGRSRGAGQDSASG